ncbi:MAG: hypothetical protein WD119_02225 [Pirellulaceae bacterium]
MLPVFLSLAGFFAALAIGGVGGHSAAADDPLQEAAENEILADGGLNPEAFYLLNEKGVRLMYPGLSFAEIERLRKLDEGTIQPTQAFNFDSVSIEGTAEENRAELDVTIRLQVDPAGQTWLAIPLLMENFNRLAPPEVTGIDHWHLDLDTARGGYLLWVQVEEPRDVVVRMRVSVRVDPQPRSSIRFQLPEVPTTVELTVPQEDAVATVEGRGNEDVKKVETEEAEHKSTFRAQSGGGEFSLLWGSPQAEATRSQVLEAESRWTLVWMSVQDRPTASVDLTVRNLRGDIQPFEIELAAGVQLLDQQGVVLARSDSPSSQAGGQRFQVRLDPQGSSDEVDIRLEVELGSRTIDAANPLRLEGIMVVDAVRQTGTVEVRSDQQYRLRWQRRPWVRSVWAEDNESGDNLQVYQFTFDRVPFGLPMWLAPKQRRLRVESDYAIRIDKAVATLQMTIRATGSTPDGRMLRVNTSGWQIQSVETAETGDPLDTFPDDELLEIDLSSLTAFTADETALVINAGRELPLDDDAVQLPIPRVVFDDDSTMVQPGILEVRTSPGLSFISNLSESVGVDELAVERTDSGAATLPTRYIVQSLGPEAVLSGFLEEDRPQVTLEADLTIAVEGERLVTTADWLLRPQRGMTGQIPLEFSVDDDWQAWDATVDQQPAVLRAVDDQIVLFSDQLVSGRHAIRFRRSDPIEIAQEAEPVLLQLKFPRPDLPEVTSGGEVGLQLRASASVSIEAFISGQPVADLSFDSLPSQPLTVRLNRRETRLRRLLMPHVVVQTHVGRSRRHERLMATVRGSGDLRLSLRETGSDLTADVTVDGRKQVSERSDDGALLIPLGADKPEHVLDVRIWYSADETMRDSSVRPAFVLPIGTGRLFWDLLLPTDEHVVWASPTLGRAMRWKFDRWRLRREPTESRELLAEWIGANDTGGTMVGNRYLFTGSDPSSVRAVTAGKPLIWATVGGFVLAISASLVYLPQLKHPLTGVAAAVAICGLTLLAPDAAVVVGQLAILSLVLVAVMMGVRAVLRGRPHDRVFDASQSVGRDGSSRTHQSQAGQQPDGGSGSLPLTATVNVGDGN